MIHEWGNTDKSYLLTLGKSNSKQSFGNSYCRNQEFKGLQIRYEISALFITVSLYDFKIKFKKETA